MRKGSKLNLPYWLVNPLYRRQWLEVSLPKVHPHWILLGAASLTTPQIYGKHFCDTLRADPGVRVVTLHDKSPYFEEFGTTIAAE